ncbi:MAG: DNA polymerase I, partial [Chloroflexi bacterium]|nr:DNA polymerase I [Chloroflexota bacterium]
KLQEKLRQNEAAARQSKQLATIVTEAPVALKLEDCRTEKYDRQAVNELFRELEFVSLRSRLPEIEAEEKTPEAPSVAVKTEAPQGNYRIISTAADLDKLVNRLAESKSFAFDLETTSLNPLQADMVGLSFSPAPAEAYYIPVGHTSLQSVAQLPRQQVIDRLKPVLEDARLGKLAHNGKYDMTVLAEHGVSVTNLTFDTMVAAYLMGEKSLGLKALAFSRLNIDMTPITDLIGTGAKQLPMSQVEIEKVADYACADADMTRRLADLFDRELREQGLWQLFADVEMPLVPVLLRMERNGITLDKALLQDMSKQLEERIATLETKIFSMAGHEFNINSPQQLGKVLFEELGLPKPRKTKTGFYSTDASVFDKLRNDYPIIVELTEYRHLAKLKSTYVDALPLLINPKTGKVHTSFNQTQTTTGRLSSSEPNLQNIAVRDELGRQIRRAFIAPQGTCLFAADYSQIDLRALAHLSRDPGLVQAFQHDEDIHAATAAQLFNVEKAKVTADMRRLAKTVNFGVIYGMSEYGLEQATELSREEAAQFIAAYFAKYPKVKEYLEATKKQARDNGYVQTILGRRRFIPEINSANRQVREAAERMAINMPVQGTSADIIKVAMLNLDREMNQKKLQSQMLLQVHDELVFEVPDAEMPTMQQLVPQVMSSALELSVPLKVDIKKGQNWGEME